MSVKKVPHGQVLIDMKTKITSYGPHNGIIVHCGIQQEPRMFWPYVLSDTSNSLCTQQFNTAPTSATIHWPTVKENDNNQSNKATSSIPNQHYQLTDKEKISTNNFNLPKKVRLNVFETVRFQINPTIIKLKSLNMTSNNCKSDLNNKTAKISNGNISSTKEPLTNAQNVDCHHNEGRAVKKKDLNENIRPESMIHSERNGQNTSIIPMEHSSKRNVINCKESSDEIMKYDYSQIKKEFVRDSSLIEIPMTTNTSKIADDNRTDWQRSNDRRFSKNLPYSFASSLNQKRQPYRNIPDLCQKQSNHRKVPERLYHLYETQDAFGNPLTQFEMELEQLLPQLSLLNISKKHLSTNYDEYNRNLNDNIGLSLISENFTPKSKLKLKDGNYAESQSKYLQHNSESSSNNIFNDAEILRHHCDSLHIRSEIPTQLKIQGSIVRTKLDENKISIDGAKNVCEKTASKLSEILPTMSSSTMNCQQLQLTAKKRSYNQELMVEKEKNFEELKNCNTDNDEVVNNAGTISIKPILHISSRKNSFKKKVQFPVEWPQVIALEHRLLINDLHLV
uniref:Uncharacterized protein n=2 Tax=Wuchereria bancrofti TaxID=6293 RepID=A0AAF5RX21_WUCBA